MNKQAKKGGFGKFLLWVVILWFGAGIVFYLMGGRPFNILLGPVNFIQNLGNPWAFG